MQTSYVPQTNPTDIVFFLDSTGSMHWCHDSIVSHICRFADTLSSNQLDWRIGVYAFRDLKEREGPAMLDLRRNIAAVKKWLGVIQVDGGGSNGGESSIDAIFDGMKKMSFRKKAQKICVLFTDDYAHDPDEQGRTMSDLISFLRKQHAVTYVVSETVASFTKLAQSNGGVPFDIHSARGDFRKLLLNLGVSISATATKKRSMRKAALRAMR